jgi:hypothetical protein
MKTHHRYRAAKPTINPIDRPRAAPEPPPTAKPPEPPPPEPPPAVDKQEPSP